ncbi:hypothetical protein E2C01_001784 [Portunus trituberculatus]|uniref:Uncharacterized protein n=1 Tax=Portunus trituberculatus TaxID=210409 RepID=A0A5B7CHK0_PORTR|nr:hypothetical protein [Portunus trituberculatus]
MFSGLAEGRMTVEGTQPSAAGLLDVAARFNLGRSVFRKPSKKFFFSFGGLEGASSLSRELSFLMGMYEGIPVALLETGGAGGGGGGLLLALG